MKTLTLIGMNLFVLFFIAHEHGIRPIAFYNLKALLLVFVPQILLVLLSHEKHQILPFLNRVFLKSTNDQDEIILQRMVTLGMVQGCTGAFLGTIQVMSNLVDPIQMGKGFALMVLSLLYGLYPTSLAVFRIRQSIQGKLGGYMLIVLPIMIASIYFVFKGLQTKPLPDPATEPAYFQNSQIKEL